MKMLLFTLFLMPYLACDSKPEVPDNEAPVSTGDLEQAAEQPLQQPNGANPGEATFTVKILETFATKQPICGIALDHVVSVRILEVKETGMGITNLPHKTQEVLMRFLFEPKDLPADGVLEIKASESLCMQASKSYFSIISHKVLE